MLSGWEAAAMAGITVAIMVGLWLLIRNGADKS